MSDAETTSPLGRRIAIYGAGGKTTLAESIAAKYSFELISTDEIHHMADWRPRPAEETLEIVRSKISSASNGWIIEGNYKGLRPHVLPLIDTAIVVQLPFRVLFWRILKRSFWRAWNREVIHGGNRESFRLTFASRDSILCEIWRKRKQFAEMGETIAAEKAEATRLIVLKSTGELNRFYSEHQLKRNS